MATKSTRWTFRQTFDNVDRAMRQATNCQICGSHCFVVNMAEDGRRFILTAEFDDAEKLAAARFFRR